MIISEHHHECSHYHCTPLVLLALIFFLLMHLLSVLSLSLDLFPELIPLLHLFSLELLRVKSHVCGGCWIQNELGLRHIDGDGVPDNNLHIDPRLYEGGIKQRLNGVNAGFKLKLIAIIASRYLPY